VRLLAPILAAIVLLGCSSEEPQEKRAVFIEGIGLATLAPQPCPPSSDDVTWLPADMVPSDDWHLIKWTVDDQFRPICKAWVKR
jgi:hypothetical protein